MEFREDRGRRFETAEAAFQPLMNPSLPRASISAKATRLRPERAMARQATRQAGPAVAGFAIS